MRPRIRFGSWNSSFVRITVRLRYIHTYIFYLAIAAQRLGAAREVVVVERRTQDLPTWFLIFVCPTRVMFERGLVKRSGITIIGWTVGFLVVNLMFLFSLPWLNRHLKWRLLLLLLWAIPFSRIVEVGYASGRPSQRQAVALFEWHHSCHCVHRPPIWSAEAQWYR